MKKVLRLLMTLLLALVLVTASVALAEASPGAAVAPVIDLTGIVNAVLAVLGALLTKRLLPWLKANTSARQQELTQAAVSTAVYAAEQLYNTHVIKDRLAYAGKWLEQQGYSVDRAQIEAEVKRQKDATQMLGIEVAGADPPPDRDMIDTEHLCADGVAATSLKANGIPVDKLAKGE